MLQILVTLAGFSLLLLMILELMREVMVLREAVGQQSPQTQDMRSWMGKELDLDGLWASRENRLVMVFMSSECPACSEFFPRIAEMVERHSGLRERILVVDDGDPQDSLPAYVPSGDNGLINRVSSASLFSTLAVLVTPTLVLLERHHSLWRIADATAGTNARWIQQRLSEVDQVGAD